MNFWEILFLFFSFQGVILALLFFLKKKGDRRANILLGIYVFLFGYNIFYNVLFWSKKLFTVDFVNLIYTNQIPWVLYAPILYLYVRRVLFNEKFTFFSLIHFLPLAYVLVNSSPGYFIDSSKKIELLINGQWAEFMYFFSPHQIKFIVLLMFVYCSLIFFSFGNSIVSLNKFKWLKWITYSFFGYVISLTTFFILRYFGYVEVGYDYFITFTMIFFIGLLSYLGFLQPEVFDGLKLEKLLPFIKYKKTGLTKSHSLELKFRLLDFMDNEQPYLDSELRLDDLANKLNLSRHHMSQIINEHFDISFFDFINRYRIKEAKTLLTEDDNSNITDVLYSCGFNNRVSFYKAFKKFVGITPSEFRSLQNKAS